MEILSKEKLNKALAEYYQSHYGERETDVWYEQPGVNVWVFKRDGKLIYLKSHILTGEVTEMHQQFFGENKG